MQERKMMKLSSITLINWYLTNPIQLQIKGNTALVGANGAGKSSIIDAIQTVLFGGNQNYIKLNASSSDKKNDRDLKSYCLGTYDPQDDQDDTSAFRLRNECYSYLGLTFESNKGEYVNLFVGMEARDSVKGVEIPLLGILRGKRTLSISDFVESPSNNEFKAMEPNLVKQRLELSKNVAAGQFEVAYFTKSKDYLEQMATSLGPKSPFYKIDPDALKRVLSKSISLKELSDISHFVDNFILESDPIDIGRLKSAQNSYEELSKQIEEAKRKIDKLGEIKGYANRAIRGFKKSSSLRWIALEKEFENLDKNAEEAYESRKSDLFNALILGRKARSIKEQLSELKQKIEALALEIKEDDVQKRIEELDTELETLNSEKDVILRSQISLYKTLKQLCLSKFGVLEIDEVDSVINRLGDALRDIENPSQKSNADNAINMFRKNFEAINKRVNEKRNELYPDIKTLKDEIESIGGLINSARNGKPAVSRKVQILIEYLRENGIQATPVCELVEVKDLSWQYAIEALLGGDLEALIVHPDDEVASFRLYRRLGGKSNFHGVNIVKTSKCERWIDQYKVGSAAELIKSDNLYALGFMHRKLGRFILVDTEIQLKQEMFAITKDGMLSTDTTVTRMALPLTLMMIKDQSHNINLWNREIKKFSDSLAQKESAQISVEDISNKLVLAKDFFEGDALISFVEIEQQLEKNETKAKSLIEQKDQMDLTHLHSLMEEVKELNRESVDLAKNRDAAIRDKGSSLNDAKHAKIKFRNLLNELKQASSKRESVQNEYYFDAGLTDELQIQHEESAIEDIRTKAIDANLNAEKNRTELNTHFGLYIENEENFIDQENREEKGGNIEGILTRINREIDVIEKYNLVKYNKNAQDAKLAVQAAFRSDVVAKLKEKFQSLKDQFTHLNRALRNKEFNSNIYKFTHQAKSEFKILIDYINKATEVELDSVNTLFDSIPTEVLEEIERVIELDNGNDYRKYFTYDVEITDMTSGKSKRLSKLLGTGSGGEKQAPFYVAIASSLASAWKTINQPEGGAGVAMLDEAFNKLDENNLRNAIQFMNDAGIQVIVAAPTDKEQVFKTAVDTVLFVARDGQVVDIDTQIMTEKGWQILRQDNPVLNPLIIEEAMASEVL